MRLLCPQVQDSDLSTDDALRYLDLLLLSDSGRALLLRSGMLQAAVPLLQQRAGAAAAAAAAVAADGRPQWGAVLEAMQFVLLYARAAVHALSQGVEQEPATLSTGDEHDRGLAGGAADTTHCYRSHRGVP